MIKYVMDRSVPIILPDKADNKTNVENIDKDISIVKKHDRGGKHLVLLWA